VIDELESSLHPLLVREVVEAMNDASLTDHAAQFLIATHDTNLLDFNLFRRDQFCFAEKNPNHGTELFRLTDLKPVPRIDIVVSKQYLGHRFGGLPPLGSLRSALAEALIEAKDEGEVDLEQGSESEATLDA